MARPSSGKGSSNKRADKRRVHRDAVPESTFVRPAFTSLLGELDTPYSRSLRARVSRRLDPQVATIEGPDPRAYSDATSFSKDYLAYSLLRKWVGLDTGVDTTSVALAKFTADEEFVKETNRLGGVRSDLVDPLCRGLCEAVIHTATHKIAKTLGAFSWDDVWTKVGFSGGASTRLPRKLSHPSNKLRGKPHVTRRASVLAMCAVWHAPHWRAYAQHRHGADPYNWVEVVPGARLDTVPKDAKTDRTIAIEPDLNMFFQKGIGRIIRLRLKRVGIDLDSALRNQEYAFIGSLDGSLATIDLASASDSVAWKLVELLLPPDWFAALDMVRSEYVTLPDGSVKRLEKISSMGNGFTFELESLIFWAITASCVELENQNSGRRDTRVSVYGDDIIAPTYCVDLLLESLKYAGFRINEAKSFWDGPFRESCGEHYFSGVRVTPFFVKNQEFDSLGDWYWLANSIRLWCGTSGVPLQRTFELVLTRLRICGSLRLIPMSDQNRSGVFSTFDEATPEPSRAPKCRETPWVQGYQYEQVVEKDRSTRRSELGSYLYTLLVLDGLPREVELERIDIKERRPYERVCTAETSSWGEPPCVVSVVPQAA